MRAVGVAAEDRSYEGLHIMRLRASELLPKTRALIEALVDGLSGYMTFCARSVRPSQIEPDLLHEPILAIVQRSGWRVLASPRPDSSGTAGTGEPSDILFMYQRRAGPPRLRQFVACQFCLVIDSPDSIVSIESEAARLHSLRGSVQRDFDDVRSVITALGRAAAVAVARRNRSGSRRVSSAPFFCTGSTTCCWLGVSTASPRCS